MGKQRKVTLEGHAFGESDHRGRAPVMPVMCATCPYGPNGDPPLRAESERIAITEGSPYCHSTGTLRGLPGTHVCHGARKYQAEIFHRLGVIPEPTFEAWDAVADSMGLKRCVGNPPPVAPSE